MALVRRFRDIKSCQQPQHEATPRFRDSRLRHLTQAEPKRMTVHPSPLIRPTSPTNPRPSFLEVDPENSVPTRRDYKRFQACRR